VADAFLSALAPAEFEALSRARRTQHQIDTALHSSAERQLERKRYVRRWPNASSTASIPTIGLSRVNWSVAGRRR